MRMIIPLAGVLVAAVAFIPAAQASSLGRPCTAAPESRWLSLEALKAKAQDQGYKVQKAKLKAACGEVYALDAKGARVELFLNPTSGAIVAQE